MAVVRLIVPTTTLRLELMAAAPRYISRSRRASARSSTRAASVGRGFILQTTALLTTSSTVATTLIALCMYSTWAGQFEGNAREPLQ